MAQFECWKEKESNSHSIESEIRMSECKHLLLMLDSLQEEPVSEELEKAAVEAFKQIVDSDKNNFLEIFKAGAKWKEEQFEKNRLAHCDAQTEEEAEIERDFVMSIIENENRQPTFDDAIKYGMRLQRENMMKGAVKGLVYAQNISSGEVMIRSNYVKKEGFEFGDKVKLIVIKED